MIIPSPTLIDAIHAAPAVGYCLINRYRPAAESPPATGITLQHHSAPS
jgi:hypothetical protein